MNSLTQLLSALASFLWPVLGFTVLFIFKPALASLLETFRLRKVTLKVGGQEVTLDEMKQQESNDIADLRLEVVALKQSLQALSAAPATTTATGAVPAALPPPRKILWVDDNPKNISSFVQQLSALGVNVDTAVSTRDAKRLFEMYSYDVVISDMGRKEDGGVYPKAGMDFLKWVRQWNRLIPFVFFCGLRAAQEHESEAMDEGATGITSSGTQLFGLLRLNELRDRA